MQMPTISKKRHNTIYNATWHCYCRAQYAPTPAAYKRTLATCGLGVLAYVAALPRGARVSHKLQARLRWVLAQCYLQGVTVPLAYQAAVVALPAAPVRSYCGAVYVW